MLVAVTLGAIIMGVITVPLFSIIRTSTVHMTPALAKKYKTIEAVVHKDLHALKPELGLHGPGAAPKEFPKVSKPAARKQESGRATSDTGDGSSTLERLKAVSAGRSTAAPSSELRAPHEARPAPRPLPVHMCL